MCLLVRVFFVKGLGTRVQFDQTRNLRAHAGEGKRLRPCVTGGRSKGLEVTRAGKYLNKTFYIRWFQMANTDSVVMRGM